MNPSMTFLRKEMLELVRTPKAIVLPAVLLAIGLMSPITAKILPEIMPSLLKDVIGTEIVIKTTGADAWLQLFKNLNQMGLFVIVLLFMGSVAEERSRGTVLIVLTKSLPRPAFLLAKFAAAALLVFVATGLAYLACLGYAAALFKDVHALPGAIGALLFFAYASVILALTILASSVSKSQPVAAGLAVAGMAILSATSLLGDVGARWSPGALSNLASNLVVGKAVWQDAIRPLAVSALTTTAFLVCAVGLFNRKEL